jgi:hypothetical protein
MSEKTRKPAVPKGTGPNGRRLWNAVMDAYILEEHELALLRESVRTIDLLDKLDQVVRKDGLVVGKGAARVHPALVEARQLKIALARLLAAMRLPSGLTAGARSPQRRVGARGVYGIRGIA